MELSLRSTENSASTSEKCTCVSIKPGVAVRQQGASARDADDDRISDQRRAGRARELAAKQGIAIAVHHQQALAAAASGRKRVDDRRRLCGSVVTDPVFEQVAEYQQFRMRRCVLAHEAQEARDSTGPRGGQAVETQGRLVVRLVVARVPGVAPPPELPLQRRDPRVSHAPRG